MNPRLVAVAIARRWRWVVALFLVCFGLGVAYLVVATPVYTSTAQIFVSTSSSSSALDLAQGNTFTEARVQSYVNVAQTDAVVVPVIKQLGLDLTPSQVAHKVSATAAVNKVIIDLSVTDTDPVAAQRLADATSRQLCTAVEQLETPVGSATSAVRLSVIQAATSPSAPTSPNRTLVLLVAILAGLVLGVAVAVLRQVLDRSATFEELLAEVDTAVLTTVPFDRSAGQHALAARVDPMGARAEAFRRLRTNLQFVQVDQPPKIIAITSALPGEGKTHTAMNFAASLAESGKRVCLIEADLRRPTVAQKLGLVQTVGLTQVLSGQAEVEDVVQNAGQNLAIITSGELPPNPAELLISEQMRRTLDYISELVDYVVIDTAPLLPVTDGAATAAIADATLLTVRLGSTTRDQVRRANEALANVDVKVAGLILSMVAPRDAGGYGGGYSYYGGYRPKGTPEERPEVIREPVAAERP